MIRLGLCCIFRNEPIKFRSTTVKQLKKTGNPPAEIVLHNAHALLQALAFCQNHSIGCFRISSTFCPAITHPDVRYTIEELPDVVATLKKARDFDIRLTMHPDQFIVLNSPDPGVVTRSIADIEYHAHLLDIVGGDVITLHAGGVYGDKEKALKRLGKNLSRLSKSALEKLALENDDKSYTPADLLPFCITHHLPFIYDVHHHRCNPDDLSIEEVTRQAIATWGKKEPLFHISSPRDSKTPSAHHDFIHPKDFPNEWKHLDITVEVEAKAKELAVLKLAKEL